MSWANLHRESETSASEASEFARTGALDLAVPRYREAAELEERAFQQIDPSKQRTLGIVGVSTVSLWFKAGEYERAEQLALRMLNGPMPTFAAENLRILLQTIWTEGSKRTAGVSFLPGHVVVSVKGGDIVVGGAPLDLIVDKVQTLQAIFYRTVEFIRGMPHRLKGGPVPEVQEACRPWLFQEAPGSYQFSIAVQAPPQPGFFRDDVEPRQIVAHFLDIVRATAEGGDALSDKVPNKQYRSTFLKLARNLAPTGRTFSQLEVKAAGEAKGILFVPETRAEINRILRGPTGPIRVPTPAETTIAGVLRALHLDQGWLVVASNGKLIRVTGLKDAVDDVIGPMVNRSVVVRVVQSGKANRFVDIEMDE
jgi:sulfur carrier protein ThiS